MFPLVHRTRLGLPKTLNSVIAIAINHHPTPVHSLHHHSNPIGYRRRSQPPTYPICPRASKRLVHDGTPPKITPAAPSNQNQDQEYHQQTKKRSDKSISIRSFLITSTIVLSIGYSIGTFYPPDPLTKLIIKSFVKLPDRILSSDAITHHHSVRSESDLELESKSKELMDSVESELNQLDIVKQLKSQSDHWSSFRPFQDLDPQHLKQSLTHGTLRGPGKFAVPPMVFVNKERNQSIAIVHIGDLMCGHDGIVHGGVLATICDEGLATLAFCNLPSNVGVTATLRITYRKPVLANQFIIFRSWIPKEKDKQPIGRKAWSDGQIENLSGDVLVQAESLFIEPKGAKFINNSKIKEYLKIS